MSMAELASAMPTSGGLYFWTYAFSSPRWRKILCWIVGYANTIGNVAAVASIDWGCAIQLMATVTIASPDFSPSSAQLFGVYTGIVLSHGVLCCLGTTVLARLQTVYIILNVLLCMVVIIVLPITTPTEYRNTVSFALGEFTNFNGWPNGFAFILSFLAPLWTICSFDASVHIAEESSNASVAVPWGIVNAISVAGLLGWAINMVLAFCMGTDLEALYDSDQPMALIFLNSFGRNATLGLWIVVVLVQYMMGSSMLLGASRQTFAFSRDGALPFSGWLYQISSYTQTPINSVWYDAILAIVMGLLVFAGDQAINAAFALSVTGLYVAYAIPIVARFWGENDFKPGPSPRRASNSSNLTLHVFSSGSFLTLTASMATQGSGSDQAQPIHPSLLSKLDPQYIQFHSKHIVNLVPPHTLPWDPAIRNAPAVPGGSEPLPVGKIQDFDVGKTKVRAYTPEGNAPEGGWNTFIFFHGGGVDGWYYQQRSVVHHQHVWANCVVVSVHYRLAPEEPYPAAIEDAVDALVWVYREGPAALNINPKRIAVGGSSSGGNLATILAIKAKYLPEPIPLIFQLLIVPVTDNTASVATRWASNKDTVWLTPDRMNWFKRNYLPNEEDWTKWDASPIFATREMLEGLPPAWIAVAELDILCDEGVAYAERLREAGVKTEVEVYKGAPHPIMAMDVSDAAVALKKAFDSASGDNPRQPIVEHSSRIDSRWSSPYHTKGQGDLSTRDDGPELYSPPIHLYFPELLGQRTPLLSPRSPENRWTPVRKIRDKMSTSCLGRL
ncbi:hypothetical protein NMY22_g15750 [Coprinellus aureogranulatus]|nr:hypothetical protein NMY22_g15750 [Coprinellus aureogranulatus]